MSGIILSGVLGMLGLTTAAVGAGGTWLREPDEHAPATLDEGVLIALDEDVLTVLEAVGVVTVCGRAFGVASSDVSGTLSCVLVILLGRKRELSHEARSAAVLVLCSFPGQLRLRELHYGSFVLEICARSLYHP